MNIPKSWQDKIRTYEEFKKLHGKDLKRDVLVYWRGRMSDKQIRETWGMKSANWYALLQRLELRTKKINPDFINDFFGDSSEKHSEESRDSSTQFEEFDDELLDDAVPPPRRTINAIDAEFIVVEEKNVATKDRSRMNLPATVDEEGEKFLSYPNVVGNAEQVAKKLATIAQLLQMEDEDQVLRLKIEVYRV